MCQALKYFTESSDLVRQTICKIGIIATHFTDEEMEVFKKEAVIQYSSTTGFQQRESR